MINMDALVDRKEALTNFNRYLKTYTDNQNLIGSKLSVCLVDIITELPSNNKDVVQVGETLLKNFTEWCNTYKRVGCGCQHFFQGRRYPHIHFIYERTKRKHNEFQDWLIDKSN